MVSFILMNVIAIFHSWKFTHFGKSNTEKTQKPGKLSFGGKVKTLFFGVNIPRPENKETPAVKFETIKLQSNVEIESWLIPAPESRGTVALFHGFSGEKSSMLDKAEVFRELGYSTLVVDFMGSGGSEGNQTTIGFKEAEQVKTCYDYLVAQGESEIFLFGTSMGAVAVMKALSDSDIQPNGIILECPFGSMYQTVCARFDAMGVPAFPMAGLLVFWGGTMNGFWGFGHNPTKYASQINCPTLLLHGEKDARVSISEIDGIFENLKGEKKLKMYPEAGHENYLTQYKAEWTADVAALLNKFTRD